MMSQWVRMITISHGSKSFDMAEKQTWLKSRHQFITINILCISINELCIIHNFCMSINIPLSLRCKRQ